MDVTLHLSCNVLYVLVSCEVLKRHLEQVDLLKGGQVDVHGDGGPHHQRHLIQQLRLI